MGSQWGSVTSVILGGHDAGRICSWMMVVGHKKPKKMAFPGKGDQLSEDISWQIAIVLFALWARGRAKSWEGYMEEVRHTTRKLIRLQETSI